MSRAGDRLADVHPRVDVRRAAEVPAHGWAFDLPDVPDAVVADVHVLVERHVQLFEAGGMDNLHMAFYKAGDIGNDGVWDVWQVEGPSMVWYFRSAPHVHTWVNIRDPKVQA